MVKTFSDEEKQEREEAKRDMKMWLAADWDLVEETPEYFLLRKNTGSTAGHFWVFVLTVWWTFGIGNLIYWYANRKTKKIIK